MIHQEDNCAAILELKKSLGSADVIIFVELARVKKERLHSRLGLVACPKILNPESKAKTLYLNIF